MSIRTTTLALATALATFAIAGESRALQPRPPSLQYFGAYDDGEDVGIIHESARFSNLLWITVADPRSPDPVIREKRRKHMAEIYEALRREPHTKMLLAGGGWVWGSNFEKGWPEVKGYYDAILPTIPPDIKSRIVAAAVADEPFLNRWNRYAEIRGKVESLMRWVHNHLPGTAAFVNFSYVEVDRNISFPGEPGYADWYGFDCYLWSTNPAPAKGSCANMAVIESYVTALENMTGPVKRLVITPQAHRHNASDPVGPIQDALRSYYGIGRRHPKVVSILPFARNEHLGVIGYGHGDAASNQIRDTVAEVGRMFLP